MPIVGALLAEIDTPPATAGSSPIEKALGAEDQGPQGLAKRVTTPTGPSPDLADPLLALAADVLDDLETVRIANENRLRQLTRDETDVDGEERGFGLTLDHPDVARLAALVDALASAEKDAAKNLAKRLKQHPLYPWLKGQKGVGDKQAARLLASIGDPFWNTLHDRPRKVSELWSYCGYSVVRVGGQAGSDAHIARVADSVSNSPAGQLMHDAQGGPASGSKAGGNANHGIPDAHTRGVGVAPKRARGAKANWSDTARTRARLIAESCIKQLARTCPADAEQGFATHADGCACARYRKVYDATRVKYADAIHHVECPQCGPKGKPAQPGSDLSRGHKHGRALRAVSKELLKDLWREARRIHEETTP
ncbi:hypothetical protein [Acrocarpospora sp. B8E8]|uniref:hypothetical protein n=1 Tax=Acrocarpospora sp. B8E8 TaxID=3153572 RepID=UPI00325FAA32